MGAGLFFCAGPWFDQVMPKTRKSPAPKLDKRLTMPNWTPN
jgi:hypothetical protein